ncbi:MAG: GEVED domain-containing protein, partial [Flavobacteriaceae bacterium]|nr:GEVED domain-containing protein [Flavobacteriaceae bacterium]
MKIKLGRFIKLCKRFSTSLVNRGEIKKIFYFNFIDCDIRNCSFPNKSFKAVSKLCRLNSLRIVLLPIIFLYFSYSFGQTTQTFTTSGTFTVPAGVTSIAVEAWGAGGGGGSTASNNQAGSGGGGGAYAKSVFSVVSGTNYNIIVGSGGAADSNGGNSTFNSNWVIAAGGQGGNVTNFIGGSGGSTASSIGTIKYAGGNGGNSSGTSFSGGGGGGAGSTGAGGNASGITRGLGTSLNGGNGGGGVSSSSVGNIGQNYGGGGSGALRSGGPNNAGGAGANGYVLISWIPGPALIVNPTSINFGYVLSGGTSSVLSYSLNGSNLLGAPGTIAINAPANFEVSLSAGSGFSSSINIPYSASTLASITIYTRFKPTATNTDYVGNITISGGGATTNVGVSGTTKLSYCSSTGNMSYQTSITGVQFNTINNITAKPSGYTDYTTQSTNINIGNSYNLSVNVNTDGNYTIYTYAWVDWNQDGDFLDAGESYNLGSTVNAANGLTSLSPLNITIPIGATIGNTRMRIATKYNFVPIACEPTTIDGEVEDYTLNVLPACTIPTISTTTPASRCGTGTLVLGATASAGTINWYAASTGGTFLGTGTSFTTPSISVTTTYWIEATDGGCTTASRTAVIATINTIPTITGTTPASRCESGTLVLGATASAGTINWFATSTGGTSLGTGTSFTTPSIATTTTYYVDATNSGCTTASRTAVIATVNNVPATPGLISGVTSPCENNTGEIYSITAVSNATSYTWSVPSGWSITSGNGTTSITVTAGIAGQNGNISVTANNTCGSSIAQSLAVTVKYCINKWKGSVSNDWNTPANWTLNMVPTIDANIIFDNAPLNHLVLDQDRTVSDITNAQPTYHMVLNGKKLRFKGSFNFSNGAQIEASANNSTIEFSGVVQQTIPSGTFLNDAVFNLTISTPNHLRFFGNLRLLNSMFTSSSGRLDAVTNNPTLTFSGNTSQTIASNQFLDEQVYNLIIDNVIGVNLNTDITINNTLTINTGKVLTVASVNQLNVPATIVNNGGTNGLILKSDVNGTASLLHNTNNVPVTVQRYISRNAEDWHFLSSPVNNQPINGSWLPSGTYGNGTGYDLYVWNEPTFCWIYKTDTSNWNLTHPAANFVTGRGYLYSVQATKPTKT